jgi:hypothetical protein
MGQFGLIFCSRCGAWMQSDEEEEKKPDGEKPRPVMRIHGGGREIVFQRLCDECWEDILGTWMDCSKGKEVP